MNEAIKKLNNRNRQYAFLNTQQILKECLNIEKNIDQIKAINEDYNSQRLAIFLNNKIKKYFSNEKQINFEQRYQKLRSFANGNEDKIVYDHSFFQLIMDFYLMVFDWAYHDKEKDQKIYYNQLSYILNECAILHKRIGQENFKEIIHGFSEGNIEVICCLGICTEIFIILHELAHIYLNHEIDCRDSEQQELEADKVAFDLLIDLINEQKNSKNEDFDCFEEYCIIAPVILFELFESVDKTSFLKYRKPFLKEYQLIEKRKQQIFDIIDEKQLYNDDAGHIYGYVAYIVDKYISILKQQETIIIEQYTKDHFLIIEENQENIEEAGLDIVYIDEANLTGKQAAFKHMITFSLKDCIDWLVEAYVFNTIMSIDESIKAVLYIFYTLVKFSTVSITQLDCIIILIMHYEGIYADEETYQGIKKDQFVDYIIMRLKEKNDNKYSRQDVFEARNRLLKYKITELWNDEIFLKEYILIKK